MLKNTLIQLLLKLLKQLKMKKLNLKGIKEVRRNSKHEGGGSILPPVFQMEIIMERLEIDIESYSSTDLSKAGVYKYAESDDFEILPLVNPKQFPH